MKVNPRKKVKAKIDSKKFKSWMKNSYHFSQHIMAKLFVKWSVIFNGILILPSNSTSM